MRDHEVLLGMGIEEGLALLKVAKLGGGHSKTCSRGEGTFDRGHEPVAHL